MDIYNISCEIKELLTPPFDYDEEGITNSFLRSLQKLRNVSSFRFTERKEKITGADWLWFIITKHGIYTFLVQAKKIKNGKTSLSLDTSYLRDGEQTAALINYSEKIGAIPIYVLYSLDRKTVNCSGHKENRTKECVFFEPAFNIEFAIALKDTGFLSQRPISCLFSCLSGICHYSSSDTKKVDLINNVIQDYRMNKLEASAENVLLTIDDITAEKCDSCILCHHRGEDCIDSDCCEWPFESFFTHYYNCEYQIRKIDENFLLFGLAKSKIQCNKDLTFELVDHFLPVNLDRKIVQQVVVSEYLGRHDGTYTHAIMGQDFRVDHTTVLSIDFIVQTLKNEWAKIPDIIENIGIFGSYSRSHQPVRNTQQHRIPRQRTAPPNQNSDVDIAIVYHQNAFTKKEHAEQLIRFVKAMISHLHKNIDFVDYAAAVQSDQAFRRSIDRDMIWLKQPKTDS